MEPSVAAGRVQGGRMRVGLAAAMCLWLGGCATDPRIEVLRAESSQLQQEFNRGKVTEGEAKRLLDSRTAELYGKGYTFCEIFYPRMLGSYSYSGPQPAYRGGAELDRHSRPFPGCDIVELQRPPPVDVRPGVPVKQ
jgi:hypothetical protein